MSFPDTWETPGSWECASIIGGKRSLLANQGCINHTLTNLLRWIAENTRPNCCKVVIAVFTRCVIEICTRKQYKPNYKHYRIIIYWGGRRYRHSRGWAIFGSYRYRSTVGDSRWFKVMISLRFKLPDYNYYG